jgi:hypothetical protein
MWSYACICILKLITSTDRPCQGLIHNPETDGQTERMNATIEAYIRMFCNHAQTNWVSLLPMVQLAINKRDAASTGISPFFLDHGHNIEPIQLGDDNNTNPAMLADTPTSLLVRELSTSLLLPLISPKPNWPQPNRNTKIMPTNIGTQPQVIRWEIRFG